jgi:hypothetical protein
MPKRVAKTSKPVLVAPSLTSARTDEPTSASAGPRASAGAKGQLPSPDDIRSRAYAKWVEAGRPPGDGVQYWLEAERELRQAKG